MTIELAQLIAVMLTAAVLILFFYLGKRSERKTWVRSGEENRYMYKRGKRFFVFDATEFDIVDTRTAQVISEASVKQEREPGRLMRSFIAFRREISSGGKK